MNFSDISAFLCSSYFFEGVDCLSEFWLVVVGFGDVDVGDFSPLSCCLAGFPALTVLTVLTASGYLYVWTLLVLLV